MNVNVSGLIERKYNSFFYLEDNEGEHSLTVQFDSTRFFYIHEGDSVMVGGRFLYDKDTLRYQIEVFDTTHFIEEW